MEGVELLPVLDRYGVSVALVVYFLVKDWKWTARHIELMTRLTRWLERQEPKERDS